MASDGRSVDSVLESIETACKWGRDWIDLWVSAFEKTKIVLQELLQDSSYHPSNYDMICIWAFLENKKVVCEFLNSQAFDPKEHTSWIRNIFLISHKMASSWTGDELLEKFY